VWEIDGTQVTLGFNKQVYREKYRRYIREFKSILENRTYQSAPKAIRRLFDYFGCVPFFRLGMDVFRIPFLEMCRYFSKIYISEAYYSKSGSFYRIPAFAYVLAFMLQYDEKTGVCSFGMLSTYAKEYRITLSQLMNEEFEAFCGAIITDALSSSQSIEEITKKISLPRVTQYCMDFAPELAEKTLRTIASGFTDKRKSVSLAGLQVALWGQKGCGYAGDQCDPRFKCLIEKIVQEEIDIQKERFIRENHLEMDIRKDVWNIYRWHGGSIALNRIDFTVINSESLRLEVKYCMIHRLNRNSREDFVSSVAHVLNILSNKNPNIKYAADITQEDARALFMFMETDYLTLRGNKLNITTIGNIFSYCSYLIDYLMCDKRSDDIRSPRPHTNPFTQFCFVNLSDYKVNTAIMPEIVAEKIDKHIENLSMTHRLMYRIFSCTGMRMKEVLFLKEDCIEPSRYENLSQIKYTPYKVLSARRKVGLEDCHRVLIPAGIATEILEYAQTTEGYRKKSGLPYIFLNAKYHGKINVNSMCSFVNAINKLLKTHQIKDENGKLWHYTTRQSRKTLAVTLIENGASTAELTYWLGHLTSSTSMRYYAEVRQMKLAQLNTGFFKKQFDLLLSKQQLETFTEEERKLLYIDFRLERRRVEFGFCLLLPAGGICQNRNSLYNCVNCPQFCTGKKYLSYWQYIWDEQKAYLEEMLRIYEESGIKEYEDFKEYRKTKFLTTCYQSVVEAIQNGSDDT